MFFKRLKKVSSTPFSDFIRNASSAERKRVYTIVIRDAIESQQKVIRAGQTTAPSPLHKGLPRTKHHMC